MAYPLDNLGDYNVVRDDLKAFGGNAKLLYEEIGKNAVEKEKPGILLEGGIGGGIVTAAIIGIGVVCYHGYQTWKKSRLAKRNEPILQKDFERELEKRKKTTVDSNEDCL